MFILFYKYKLKEKIYIKNKLLFVFASSSILLGCAGKTTLIEEEAQEPAEEISEGIEAEESEKSEIEADEPTLESYKESIITTMKCLMK